MIQLKRTFAILLLACMCSTVYSQCPKTKENGIIGKPSDLPSGMFVYSVDGINGLFFSPVQEYSPKKIAGTENDNIILARFSDDGTWILYHSFKTNKLFLIRPDGSGKAQVPVTDCSENSGWVRNGPFGDEIFYTGKRGNTYMKGIRVDLKGKTPAFGLIRTIANGIAFKGKIAYGQGVAKNHIFCTVSRNAMYTIPNDGKGTATNGDGFQFSSDITYGCGPAISYDGTIVSENTGQISGFPCIIKGHRGPAILPFMESKQFSSGKDLYTRVALSINFGPVLNNDRCDFHMWDFTNSNDYIACRATPKTDGQSAMHGAAILHWKSNTWTLLTPGLFNDRTKKVATHACYFTGTPTGTRLRIMPLKKNEYAKHIMPTNDMGNRNLLGRALDLQYNAASASVVYYNGAGRIEIQIRK